MYWNLVIKSSKSSTVLKSALAHLITHFAWVENLLNTLHTIQCTQIWGQTMFRSCLLHFLEAWTQIQVQSDESVSFSVKCKYSDVLEPWYRSSGRSHSTNTLPSGHPYCTFNSITGFMFTICKFPLLIPFYSWRKYRARAKNCREEFRVHGRRSYSMSWKRTRLFNPTQYDKLHRGSFEYRLWPAFLDSATHKNICIWQRKVKTRH